MTTATHSLDATSGATTVAELLARNGARTGQVPHRRARPGGLEGTLPAFPPVDETATQYRYDQTTVAALLEAEPRAEKNRPARAGLKIAGLAFAGAVLAGGWALTNAQPPGSDGGDRAAGPVPSNNTPESGRLLASAPVGAQVVTLASAAPASTAAIPATAPAKQPDQGRFTGKLPSTAKPAPAKPTAAAPPRVAPPKLPAGTYVWPVNPGGYQNPYQNWPRGGGRHWHR
ncbi:hypothetical protein [Amycolatopsis pithecellobii]|uniref:Uncharacterized protein n=1 Tax=Amycolatopsis pithecellobii TaxID=664692 RepID=A0A6N7Z4Q2_9PSEU|nr:hypothetical protein [Amycolatopsis pithecellobii]MTD54246.1 hypothetical protein [Amycolatopsis pithecellobii]